jgi:dynein heavy chain
MQALLDDQIVKAQSMRASPFIKPLEERARNWEELLVNLQVRAMVILLIQLL